MRTPFTQTLRCARGFTCICCGIIVSLVICRSTSSASCSLLLLLHWHPLFLLLSSSTCLFRMDRCSSLPFVYLCLYPSFPIFSLPFPPPPFPNLPDTSTYCCYGVLLLVLIGSSQRQTAWDECLTAFGRENVVIVSNSAGSGDDHHLAEAKAVEAAFGVPVLRHPFSKKPNCIQDIHQHFKTTSADASKYIVVGDRLLTDIYMGRQLGALTIHTQPFTEKGDSLPALLIRRVENFLLRTILQPTGPPTPPSSTF
eukprot:m.78415 g.78415  ORF g.78415 m.78415 type:complete len:254 (-) comp14108_c0_seq2:195-956(-)